MDIKYKIEKGVSLTPCPYEMEYDGEMMFVGSNLCMECDYCANRYQISKTIDCCYDIKKEVVEQRWECNECNDEPFPCIQIIKSMGSLQIFE